LTNFSGSACFSAALESAAEAAGTGFSEPAGNLGQIGPDLGKSTLKVAESMFDIAPAS
jgi:hypothetical protein